MKNKIKNKKTGIIAIIGILVLGALAVFGAGVYRVYQTKKLLGQQNYIASRLLEMGEYEQGRILAIQTNQIEANAVSEELIVLAAGFQSDYETGISCAEKYLEHYSDDVIKNALNMYQDYIDHYDAENIREQGDQSEEKSTLFEKLMSLLFQVEKSIDVKINAESLQVMLSMMSLETTTTWEDIETLEKDNSLLSQKMQAVYAMQTGDYAKACEKAEKVFEKSDIFEHRALLANTAARENTSYYGYWEDDNSADRQDDSVMKAINFIEIGTPVTERGSSGYPLELAYLYYQAKDEQKAEEWLGKALHAAEEDDEALGSALLDFIESYQIRYGLFDRLSYDGNKTDPAVMWSRVSRILNLIDTESNYYGENQRSFYDFVLEVMDGIYNGLIIRRIDVSDFPIVRITVNTAFETEKVLSKEDISFMDMGKELKEFSFSDTSEIEMKESISVALVVDHSGSMNGKPLEDTKKAVTSFVKEVSSDAGIGLIMFDDIGEVVTPITKNHGSVLQDVKAIQAEGGTSIWSGLKVAGDELMREPGTRIIILLSDGEDGNRDMIEEVLEELNSRNIYVYAIGFGGADIEYLTYIATSCHGKFIQAVSSEMLGEIYAEIGGYMTDEYVIEFEAVTDLENFTRDLKIDMKQNQAFVKKNYHVGVPYEEIMKEQNQKPVADYFMEIGGSRIETE